MGLKQLFGNTSSIRPQMGDRVRNNNTRQIGTVTGKSIIKGSVRVPALSVQYDDGTLALQIPENEFLKIGAGVQSTPKPVIQAVVPKVERQEVTDDRGYSSEPGSEIVRSF